jgi:hypothetical protein
MAERPIFAGLYSPEKLFHRYGTLRQSAGRQHKVEKHLEALHATSEAKVLRQAEAIALAVL